MAIVQKFKTTGVPRTLLDAVKLIPENRILYILHVFRKVPKLIISQYLWSDPSRTVAGHIDIKFSTNQRTAIGKLKSIINHSEIQSKLFLTGNEAITKYTDCTQM